MHKLFSASIATFLLVGAATMAPGATIIYSATLNGANEAPANLSLGIGSATITVDDVARTIGFQISFSGLSGTTTQAHIHAATTVAGAGTAGVATQSTLVGFPLGVTSGTFSNVLDMNLAASFNSPYVTAHGGTPASAFTDLNQAIIDGKAYFNIHTAAPNGFPSGEIRGFLAAVPEPTSLSLVALGGILSLGRRRRD